MATELKQNKNTTPKTKTKNLCGNEVLAVQTWYCLSACLHFVQIHGTDSVINERHDKENR